MRQDGLIKWKGRCAADSEQANKPSYDKCLVIFCSRSFGLHVFSGAMLSFRGRCFSFNNTADGYGRGEGSAACVLSRGKRLDEWRSSLSSPRFYNGNPGFFTTPWLNLTGGLGVYCLLGGGNAPINRTGLSIRGQQHDIIFWATSRFLGLKLLKAR